MQVPSRKAFLNSKEPIPVFRKRSLGGLNPLDIFQKLAHHPPAFLLESIKGPERTCRYSFIATEPFLIFESKGNWIRLTKDGSSTMMRENPLNVLSNLLTRFHVPRPTDLPPFFGGIVGLFSYDLVHIFEDLPRTTLNDLGLNDLYLAFFESVLAVDHVAKALYMIFCPTRERFYQSDRMRLYRHAHDQLDQMESSVFSDPGKGHDIQQRESSSLDYLKATITRKEYHDRIRRCQAYIAHGDIFQANLSLRFCMPIQHDSPINLYRTLRMINPSPFGAFVDLGDLQLLSSSPERLIRVSADEVETRPIAGTRPRGRNISQDRDLNVDLLTNAKERAEHLMLLDLERNDLGKVCQFGSIKVDEFMVTERYSHVMHIVSNIKGTLKKDKDCLDALRAVFPGGTVTGVPKIRCMQIIDELEPVSRGFYTGSLGYISFAGDMDLNILIRSILLRNHRAYVQVGAGIVADSDPEREYQECLYKAEALMKSFWISQDCMSREDDH